LSLVGIIVALLLGACSKASAPPRAPSNVTIPQDLRGVEIALDRSECFGVCASYSVAIDGGGHVHYVGRSSVAEEGAREANIPQAQVRTLLDRFVSAGFFVLNDSYREPVTDMQTTTLTVKIADRVKRVENYWSRGLLKYPPEQLGELHAHADLDTLADAVDYAVEIQRWVGADAARLHPNR
jgi:hypothetical protein